ncbi:MAG: sigma-70 family RNA polymerase sigma factor, partial [Akkermansiaceae bacterium]|nr:sigma-70 family RNA polymerase sigma factor [Akkermansiaceae bacterium]
MIKEEQFVRLFVQHETELRSYALTLIPSLAEAEDVVQDACVAMWKRIGDLENKEAFRSWAYTFIRFTALNRIRKKQRSPLVFSEALTEIMAEEGSEELERAGREQRALMACLQKLSDRQRDLIQRYYASASVRMEQLANDLKRSRESLYKMLQRTRQDLRDCIEATLRDDAPDAHRAD